VAVTDQELLVAEEYLERHGYLARADITLTRGTYTMTPAGLKWLERGSPQPLEVAETIAERSEKSEPKPAAGGAQEGARRPWWRRMFGG
jgi:DNA-binding PadR family transcriptional regulator